MSDLIDNVTRGNFPCPWCDEPNDAAALLKGVHAAPRPGDVALCASCAKPSIYQEHGKPRRPTETEWKKINADESITRARKAIFMGNRGNVSYRDLEVQVRGDDDE